MITQFKKGVVELCVLKIISNKDMYGFEVIESLTKELQVNENTIYPILRRLTKQGLFTTYQKSTTSGAPRKYYKITKDGVNALNDYLDEWNDFQIQVKKILGG